MFNFPGRKPENEPGNIHRAIHEVKVERMKESLGLIEVDPVLQGRIAIKKGQAYLSIFGKKPNHFDEKQFVNDILAVFNKHKL